MSQSIRLILGAMVLLVVLAPQVSSAYKVVCVNGYTSFLCNDGTKSICTAGGQQFDCPEANGERQCANHGGLAAIITDLQSATADYLGKLDLSSMQCPNCDTEGTTPIYATWLGTCGDKAMMTCSEMDRNCASKQAAFRTTCSQLREVLTSTWHLEFSPKNTCSQPTDRSSQN